MFTYEKFEIQYDNQNWNKMEWIYYYEHNNNSKMIDETRIHQSNANAFAILGEAA